VFRRAARPAHLAAKIHPANGTVHVPGLAPNDDVEPTRVRLNEEVKNIMLVGHLPYLSRLVSRLLGLERDQALVRVQMGGVVKLEREDADRWVLRWILTPELL
jgi:phosphohistidine phosphatase